MIDNLRSLAFFFAALFSSACFAGDFVGRAEVDRFVAQLVEEDQFDSSQLMNTLRLARHQQKVIAAMDAPIRKPPEWHQYRPWFVNQDRLTGGRAFWIENEAVLAKAERQYGVPAEFIVSIIGVETMYGRLKGGFRVLDSLTTLAFDYPRRAEYFREELRQFLLLAREQRIAPETTVGSYAGAIGLPQFMPTSIRKYAVDFDGDGKIDLLASRADVIGSVANFLVEHGWQKSTESLLQVSHVGDVAAELAAGGISEPQGGDIWRDLGIKTAAALDAKRRYVLVRLEGRRGNEYCLGTENFLTIMRYNRSRLYAAAVTELAVALRHAKQSDLALKTAK